MDERRDRWRPLFRARLAPLVAGAGSLTDAALRVNAGVWALWGIRFKADSTPDVLSPFQARLVALRNDPPKWLFLSGLATYRQGHLHEG